MGLSSNGAQHESGTGNLVASYMLEHIFSDLDDIEQIYVRPSYYFSNWFGYLELVRENGILPAFFPPEMEVSMIAPADAAEFLSSIMVCKNLQQRIYEITGPWAYSSVNIAKIFEEVLNRNVAVQQVQLEEWENTLLKAGFSKDGAKNLMLMTRGWLNKPVAPGKSRRYIDNLISVFFFYREI